MSEVLDIGEIAARSGLAPSALRYYESQELILSTERKGLRRQYSSDVLDTLAVITLCRRAGFSLSEIKTLLATRGGRSCKALAVRKRDELRAQIEHLEALADQLDHALDCPSPNVFDCDHFRAAVRSALPAGGKDQNAGKHRL
jgi:DNA-binding transcriptional MerR regulator